jgi:hypothetical protein
MVLSEIGAISFEEYLLCGYWRQLYRLIEAAGVIDNIVEMCPSRTQIVPTNECEVNLNQERQAVKAAGDKVSSGRQVKDVVDRIRERTLITKSLS